MGQLASPFFVLSTMPMKAMKTMKAMKAGSSKAMTKGGLTAAIAEEHQLKQKVCREVLDSFVTIAAAEVKKNGIFNVPNLELSDALTSKHTMIHTFARSTAVGPPAAP